MSVDYSAYVGIGHNHPETLELTKLAEEQYHAEQKVERLEEELKKAQEELREIAERKLPEKMESLGLNTFSTSDGLKVQVVEKIRASLAAENKQKGHSWLEDNGYGGLIKSKVVVDFKRNEIEEANQLVEELRAEQRSANLDRKVEPMTLQAFIKEQLAQGKDIPLDIFGVYRQRIAKVEL